jgi:tricarballylate dehydrogenase
LAIGDYMSGAYDVVVVGAGNAAFCAALAAREKGARVLVLERAPEDEAGGNSRFTAGLMRVAYNGVDDLKRVMPDLSAEEIARTDFGTYSENQFLDDMARVTEYRCDPDLTEILVKGSLETVAWDAFQRRAFHRRLGAAGVQCRRQVQILGRPHGRGRGRRPGPGRGADRRRAQERDRHLVRGTRDRADRR